MSRKQLGNPSVCNFCKLEGLRVLAKKLRKKLAIKQSIDSVFKGFDVYIGTELMAWYPDEPTVCTCGEKK